MKKLIPYLLLLVLFVVAFYVKQYREQGNTIPDLPTSTRDKPTSADSRNALDVFRDPDAEYYFTKHARCRMECRRITQKEVKEIVRKANVNYRKSDLKAAEGPKYALEGITSRDKQHVRIIVAPKQRHLSIVTVIDLDKEWDCPGCD
jgi:Domain of unknown function (DUF4258)